MSIFSLFGRSKKPSPDEGVINEVRKAGSDLSKAHSIEFVLYFPTQEVAENASRQIHDMGFQADVKKSAKGEEWLCFATKTMLPELVALQKIRFNFDTLAASLNGDYDGWGTPIQK
jgi:regulator of RNase E activity RraB